MAKTVQARLRGRRLLRSLVATMRSKTSTDAARLAAIKKILELGHGPVPRAVEIATPHQRHVASCIRRVIIEIEL